MSEHLGLILTGTPRREPQGQDGERVTAAKPVVAPRPFNGFDVERETYRRESPRLIAEAPGQYVVIVGDDCRGALPSLGEARRVGYATFGPGPLYIKRLEAEPTYVEVTRGLDGCRF